MRSGLRARRSGAIGEDEAEAFLRRAGYRILARNFRVRIGEVDIVAEDGDAIVFVEVKRRESVAHGRAHEFISAAKMRRVVAAARIYAAKYGLTNRSIRFDVVAIEPGGEGAGIRHFRGAFTS